MQSIIKNLSKSGGGEASTPPDLSTANWREVATTPNPPLPTLAPMYDYVISGQFIGQDLSALNQCGVGGTFLLCSFKAINFFSGGKIVVFSREVEIFDELRRSHVGRA